MAKTKTNQNATLISMLAQERSAIFSNAEVQGERDLTQAELDKVNAINFIIARTQAANKREAAIQADTVFEIFTLDTDGGSPVSDACAASLHSALQSMRSALAPPARRRAA